MEKVQLPSSEHLCHWISCLSCVYRFAMAWSLLREAELPLSQAPLRQPQGTAFMRDQYIVRQTVWSTTVS